MKMDSIIGVLIFILIGFGLLGGVVAGVFNATHIDTTTQSFPGVHTNGTVLNLSYAELVEVFTVLNSTDGIVNANNYSWTAGTESVAFVDESWLGTGVSISYSYDDDTTAKGFTGVMVGLVSIIFAIMFLVAVLKHKIQPGR